MSENGKFELGVESLAKSFGASNNDRFDSATDSATDSAGGRQTKLGAVIGLGLVLVAFLTISDILTDVRENPSVFHIISEVGTLAFSVLGAFWLLRQIFQLKSEVEIYKSEITTQSNDALHWRKEAEVYVRGVGQAVDVQLKKWSLSPSECEIAFLILKGLAYKEIADVRGVSERTIRQQAGSIFKKSNLASRTELAAFFLEDLLPPHTIDGISGV